jgi:hypothetical protein
LYLNQAQPMPKQLKPKRLGDAGRFKGKSKPTPSKTNF